MLPIGPGIERIDLSEDAGQLVIEIWRKRSLYMAIGLGLWILMFLAFGCLALPQLITEVLAHEYGIFHLALAGPWMLLLIAACFSWFWNFRGRETISLNGKEIIHEKRAPFYRNKLGYEADAVRGISVLERGFFYSFARRRIEYWGFGGGSILVEFTDRSRSMGMLLDELDTHPIVAKMNRFLNGSNE